MSHGAVTLTKIPTESSQPARRRPGPGRKAVPKIGSAILALAADAVITDGDGRPVIEMACGITVYPAREEGDRWRAVWYVDGQRRQCESVSEHKLAVKLEKVTERLTADAPNMERPGAELAAHYLDPAGRHAVVAQACPHPAAAVRAVRPPGDRRPGLPGHQGQPHAAGRQRRVHSRRGRPRAADDLRAGDRRDRGRVPDQHAAGEGPLAGCGPGAARPGCGCRRGVRAVGRPAEIPADADITALAAALAAGAGGYRGELMANTAAYAGLRWGELTALTTGQADTAARVIAVDRKVVEVAGHLYIEPPKNRKKRATISPPHSRRLPRRQARGPH